LANGDKFSDFVKAVIDSPCVKLVGVNCTSPEYIKNLLKVGAPFLNGKAFVVYPNTGEKYDCHSKELSICLKIFKFVYLDSTAMLELNGLSKN
jgi:S-methylmethionine-dependent homocysteine/selenocysteine methylase